jgi:hypothetical protein
MQLSDYLTMSDREAFEQLRDERGASMILVDVLPEAGEIYYYGRAAYRVWVVVGTHSVIVAYAGWERELAEIRRHVEFWDRARRDGVPPKLDFEFGSPVYALTDDPQTNQVTAVWFHPGDWLGLLMNRWKGKPSDLLPRWWPDADRERISQLARERAQSLDRRET